MTKHITADEIIKTAAEFGIKASLWHKGDKLRIYVKTDAKDMAVFLELAGDPTNILTAAFKVFCNDENKKQDYKTERCSNYRIDYNGIMHAYMLVAYAYLPDDVNKPVAGISDDIRNSVRRARLAYDAIKNPRNN